MFSFYYETLYAWKCKGTHHKLALEALPLLSGEDSEDWHRLFLRHIESYLTGAQDPDIRFQDFRNHVLHPGEPDWGGAVQATREWYGKTRDAFSEGNWRQGVYSAGVMSHYLTDVFCPLHTGDSERANQMHRACEWSVSCCYDELVDLLQEDLGGFPSLSAPPGEEWLGRLIRDEAGRAHFLFHPLVDGYDFEQGIADPALGLDEKLSRELALLLGRASAALALVLDRCFKESGQKPPRVSLGLHALLSRLALPVFWYTQARSRAAQRSEVRRIYRELQRTGTVERNLPAENRIIRELKQQETESADQNSTSDNSSPHNSKPRTTVTARPAGLPQEVTDPFEEEAIRFGARPTDHLGRDISAAEQDQPANPETDNNSNRQPSSAEPQPSADDSRFYLAYESPIIEAPSIGPKIAGRLRKIGIDQVYDFLSTEPHEIAERLRIRWITPEMLAAWQQQADLMCTIPGLRGHAARILQGVGVQDAQDLATATTADLLSLVQDYMATPEGEQISRGDAPPDLGEVQGWIDNATSVLHHRAA